MGRHDTLLKDVINDDSELDPQKMMSIILSNEEYIETMLKDISTAYFFYCGLSEKQKNQLKELVGHDKFNIAMSRLAQHACRMINQPVWENIVREHGDPVENREEKDRIDKEEAKEDDGKTKIDNI